ncbi:MAG: septum formation initiator family protein [Syntrophobacteraceae bacterium]
MNRFRVKVNEQSKSSKFFKGVHILQMLAVGLVALNLLVLYGIFFSSQGVRGYRQQCGQVEELTDKIQKLKEQNQKLFRKIQALKNDSKAQEKLVRQQLGWTRENEVVIEFPPHKNQVP